MSENPACRFIVFSLNIEMNGTQYHSNTMPLLWIVPVLILKPDSNIYLWIYRVGPSSRYKLLSKIRQPFESTIYPSFFSDVKLELYGLTIHTLGVIVPNGVFRFYTDRIGRNDLTT